MIITRDSYIHKIIGLGLFQNAVLLFFTALGKLTGGRPPILDSQNLTTGNDHIYSSPLPHVLMLTAIVVGFATTAVAMSLALRIKRSFNSISAETLAELVE